MNRQMIGLCTAVLFLLGVCLVCGAAANGILKFQKTSDAILDFNDLMVSCDTEVIYRERDLARWYNLRLRQKGGSEELTKAYGQLLSLCDEMMGYVEIPQTGARLPFCHGRRETSPADALEHDPQSSLPVGGLGNHCVLRSSGEEGQENIGQLKEGELFYIHILSDVLVYEVTQVRQRSADAAISWRNVEGEDLCTLVTVSTHGAETVQVQISGRRVEPELEKLLLAAQVPAPVDQRILRMAIGAALAAGLLPLAAQGLAESVARIKDRLNCSSFTKNI